MNDIASPTLDGLLAEIGEQPAVIERVIDRQHGPASHLARVIREREPRAVVLVARGSSDNAAIYGRYLLEIRNGLLTSLALPSAVTLYAHGPRLENTVVIGVSQSGRGEDVVSYLRWARAQGALAVAVVNDTTSPLAEAAEWVLDCLAGPEVSVPATKTVMAQMAILALLSAALAGEALEAGLAHLPATLARTVAARAAARDLARAIVGTDRVAERTMSVIGRGFAFPAALEIALKLKETSYTQAEPFSAADFLHGPLALVDPDYAALLVDVGGVSTTPALEMADIVRGRGGAAFLLRAGRLARAPVEIPTLALEAPIEEPYAPIVALALGQLLAVEVALARGLDPSQPRALSKVTSTR